MNHVPAVIRVAVASEAFGAPFQGKFGELICVFSLSVEFLDGLPSLAFDVLARRPEIMVCPHLFSTFLKTREVNRWNSADGAMQGRSYTVSYTHSFMNRFIVAVITMIFNSYMKRFNMFTKIVGCGSFVTSVFTLMFNGFMYSFHMLTKIIFPSKLVITLLTFFYYTHLMC